MSCQHLRTKTRRVTKHLSVTAKVVLFQIYFAIDAFAQGYGQYQEEPGGEKFLYKMITGGFGTFVIIFMGMGGVASIFMTRDGESSKKVPVLGVVMLLIGWNDGT